MRIVIDARMYDESGIGRYTRNLIQNLSLLNKSNEYFLVHTKDQYDRLVYHARGFHKVLANFRWYGVSEQVMLPKILNRLEVDLAHFPHFNVPIFYHGKFLVTIHDLIHQHFRMKKSTTHGTFVYKIKQLGYKRIFLNAIKNSEKILVPSNFVKDQLINEWGVSSGKIIITKEAVDGKLLAIASSLSKKRAAQIMEKFNIKKPYLFYIGNAHPHKNVEGLIKTFLKLKEKYKDLSLVLSGSNHYFWQKVKRENRYDGVIYTGYIIDEELVALYKNASVFVMPSFEEGFGIPLLEAMACSCPVVSSNGGALQEVGGDAAYYFDQHNLSDMRDKIDRILNNRSLRNRLIEKGQERYKLFSWEKLAKQTLEVYNQCASQ